jgi:hypothetical protein
MVIAVALVMAVLQSSQAARATILAHASDSPNRNFRVIHDDADFLFAARDYGSSRYPAGQTEPGLFVHSKATDRWIQISAISTAGGRFGKSTSDNPEAARRLSTSQVGWDFTAFARRPYMGQPLSTGSSIVFPDSIELDRGTGVYELRYMSSWKIATTETVLYINRADLVAVFEKR